ncbi:MAG TPA: hypothetical protein PKZ76_06250 [Xanthomonadaceae bacterium]|nr:hypothetical protein [Xanthomonadaceae bacterium]
MRRLNVSGTWPCRVCGVHARGFSVVELMVALAASLVVVGSVLAFTVATVQSNAETIRATRLTQDIRVVMGLLTREIRRAGHDALAEQSIASNEPGNRFIAFEVNEDGNCVLLAYNRRPAAGGAWNLDPAATPQQRELKGFRHVLVDGVGVIEAYASESDVASEDLPDCEDGSDLWRPITSARQIDITELNFDIALIERNVAGVDITVRQIGIDLAARLTTDPVVFRRVRESVRVRADEVFFPDP